MAFRGYFSLNDVEFANSSRAAAHLGSDIPMDDSIFGGTPGTSCALVESEEYPGNYVMPADAVQVKPGLFRPPNGFRRYGPGMFAVGDCWGPADSCNDCVTTIQFDDSWDGLATYLSDGPYRPEIAPWYSTELPESGEFGGVWVMDVQGLDTVQVSRPIIDTVDAGGAAGPHRDLPRVITFEAVLFGCSNAGVDYGLKWLTCVLRDTVDNTTTRLRYLTAHPGDTDADPAWLARDLHGVVLTKAPEIKERIATGESLHANMYRVTWELTATNPYAYLPSVTFDVDWDSVTSQPINWIHAADCRKPETCDPMPVMFSTECVPEQIEVVDTPPPVCGGCMPIGGIDKYSFQLPSLNQGIQLPVQFPTLLGGPTFNPFRCRDTAVSMVIRNFGAQSLSLQAFWRVCGADVRCDDNQWPLQVSGLPSGAELYLDAVEGRYWAFYDERYRRPVGVVGTPNGAPWRPPVINREICWEFVIQTASYSEFEVTMTMNDREA